MGSEGMTPPIWTSSPPSMEQSPDRVSQVMVPILTELSSLAKKKSTYQLLYSVPDKHMSHLTLTSTTHTLILSPTHLCQYLSNSAFWYAARWLYLSLFVLFLPRYQHYSSKKCLLSCTCLSVRQLVRDQSHWTHFHYILCVEVLLKFVDTQILVKIEGK